MSVNHAPHQECGLVRLIAPGMICAADDDRVARAQDDIIDSGNQVDFALATNRSRLSLICTLADGFVQLVLRSCVFQLRLQKLCLGLRFLSTRRLGLRA
jgi:hypothetical protein